jgi:hypothetical protein
MDCDGVTGLRSSAKRAISQRRAIGIIGERLVKVPSSSFPLQWLAVGALSCTAVISDDTPSDALNARFLEVRPSMAAAPEQTAQVVSASPSGSPTNAKVQVDQNVLSETLLDDYLLQDLCFKDGQPLPVDPLNCPNDSILVNGFDGARIPYLRYSQGRYLAAANFAGRTKGGARQWNANYDWGPNGYYLDANRQLLLEKDGSAANQSFFEMSNRTSSPNAVDIVDTIVINHSPLAEKQHWVAFAGTDENNWYDTCATRSETGGWLIAPLGATFGSSGSTSSTLGNAPVGHRCDGVSIATTITSWNWTEMIYTSGKKLRTIWVDHFCNADTDTSNDCLERHYFTREYGLTRWERWESNGTKARPTEANPFGCNGDWTNGHYWRMYCFDFSFVEAAHKSWNPRSFYMHEDLGNSNVIQNGDWGYRNATFWSAFRAEADRVRIDLIKDSASANRELLVECESCAGSGFYQDVVRRNFWRSGDTLHFGIDARSIDGTADATLVLFQLSSTGTIVSQTQAPAVITPGRRAFVTSTAPLQDATRSFRLQMYLGGKHAKVAFDDAFLTNW